MRSVAFLHSMLKVSNWSMAWSEVNWLGFAAGQFQGTINGCQRLARLRPTS